MTNNMLQQENAELQSELDTANKLGNTRLLVKKHQELKDEKRGIGSGSHIVCIIYTHAKAPSV